jgi:hypothetical protein
LAISSRLDLDRILSHFWFSCIRGWIGAFHVGNSMIVHIQASLAYSLAAIGPDRDTFRVTPSPSIFLSDYNHTTGLDVELLVQMSNGDGGRDSICWTASCSCTSCLLTILWSGSSGGISHQHHEASPLFEKSSGVFSDSIPLVVSAGLRVIQQRRLSTYSGPGLPAGRVFRYSLV